MRRKRYFNTEETEDAEDTEGVLHTKVIGERKVLEDIIIKV